MLDGRWKTDIERRLQPVGSDLSRTGITADHLTLLGAIMAVAAALAIANGALRLGVLLLAATALPDALDGAVAKATGTSSPRGAFLDSVADRFTDSVLLGGVAWYLSSTDGERMVLLPFALLAASTLVSYQRARAESLGFDARGGLMERAERIMALGVGLLFDWALVPVLWIMLVLTAITAAQRFVKVWRQAGAPIVVSPARSAWRSRRLSRPRDRTWSHRPRSRRRSH
jgi:CDP-diacylglycerol--glycerol-3-phosphate 3-phosphatidyltransferase